MKSPQNPQALFLEAQSLFDHGDLRGAEKRLTKLLKVIPRSGDVLNLLGLTLHRQGQSKKGMRQIAKAIEVDGAEPGYLTNMGLIARSLGDWQKAESCYRRALEAMPELLAARVNLGVVLRRTGRLNEAVDCYIKALEIDGKSLEALSNLAEILDAQGEMVKAENYYRQALAQAPEHLTTIANFGAFLRQEKRCDEALAILKKGLALAPDHPGVNNALGNLFHEDDRFSEAETHFAAACRAAPEDATLALNYAALLKDEGRIGESLDLYRRHAKKPFADKALLSSYLFTLNYDGGLAPDYVLKEHRKTAARFETPPAIEIAALPAPGEKIRVGYVSPDFRRHSVAYFIGPVLASHDREKYEIFGYSDVKKSDETTATLKASCDHWRECRGVSDEALAVRIAEDGIHILVDLAGYTANNRVGVFARRGAPVQVSWLGYPNSSGLKTMDYRLTDRLADPEGSGALYPEKLLRLEGGFLSFQPLTEPPALKPSEGVITFGSFNNLAKITPEAIDAWSQILKGVEGSKLLLKGFALADEGVKERYQGWFAQRGISADRLILVGNIEGLDDHLDLYNQVDIALDTFPYNGTTTTFEALLMGTPVLGLRGDRHCARVGESILGHLGLAELLAETPDDYVRKAIALGHTPEKVADYGNSLRGRLRNSSLCDSAAFTAELERAYQKMIEEKR
jgi:protein O-GlcNAc transferase